MYAHTEILSDHDPALATDLRGAGRIDLNDLAASVCSFAHEDRKELRPAGVVNRLRQKPAGHPRDVETFYRDAVVRLHQPPRQLVRVIASRVCDACVSFGQQLAGVAAALAPALATADRALRGDKLLLGRPQVSWVGERRPVVKDGKRRKSHIESARAPRVNAVLARDLVASEHHVPALALALERGGLDAADHRAMPDDLEFAWNAVDFEPTARREIDAAGLERALARDLRERKRVVMVAALETRVARCRSSIAAPEEPIERAVQPFEDVLQDLRVHPSDIRSRGLDLREISLLSSTRSRDSGASIRLALLFQRGVIELATGIQRALQLDALRGRGTHKEFERFGRHVGKLTRELVVAKP